MIFLILALIWAAALLPPLLRARLAGNPVDSVGKFRRHLRVLESTSPAANALAGNSNPENRSAMPVAWARESRRLRVLRRRNQVFRTLVAMMGTTLVLGLLPQLHLLLVVHVGLDVAFVMYARSLVRLRAQTAPAINYAEHDEEAEPLPLVARSAGSSAL